MSCFDFSAALGRMAASPAGFSSPAELKAELSRLGIHEALVYHQLAAEADVDFGNRQLSCAIEGEAGLYPCWVMTPPTLGDLPEPAAWVREAVAAGVRAVRVFPRHSLYSLGDWCCGPLCAALEAEGLPLILDFGERHWSERLVPWGEVRELCARYPRLPVVVTAVTTGEARDAVGMLRHAPNLHLECHAFSVPDVFRTLAREGLVSRLLFGTGLPARAGECAVEQAARSGLSPEELSALCAGNARRLLGLDPSSCDAEISPAPTRGPVIDMHAHCGAWERTLTRIRAPEDFLGEMDRCAVQQMVVSSFAAIHGETPLGNAQTAEFVSAGEGRVFGYMVVNPHYPEETRADLRRYFEDEPGFVGLKVHCTLHGVQAQHPGYGEALEFASDQGLPVLVHGGGQDDWRGVAARHPGAPIIMAHGCLWNGFDSAGREQYAALRTVPNLYVDLAGSGVHRGALRVLVDLAGADKVLFASDFPMFDMAFALGRVVRSTLSPAEQTAICGGNARRLFRRIRQEHSA
jgi:hypothetical protein